MKFKRLNLSHIVSLIILITTLSVYVYSACRYNPGYADSDEMITIGYLLGSAHPSGYPLQIILIKLFTLLPIPGSIAFRANLLNSVLHSLTVFIVFKIGLLILNLIQNKKDKEIEGSNYLNIIISASGALLLAFSSLFWLYSGVMEVASLNDFLAVLTVWTALKWQHSASLDKKKQNKVELIWFITTCVLAGIGITHVHTFILLYPGFLLLLIITLNENHKWLVYGWKRLLLFISGVFCGFIIPNLSLFWLNSRQQNVSWYFEQSFRGWVAHIARKIYSGYIPEKGLSVNSYITKINFAQYFKTFPYYWKFLGDHFTLFAVLIGIIGLTWLAIKYRKIFAFIGTWILTTGLIFAIYMGVPDISLTSLEYRSLVGISHRQYLIGETMWSMAVIIGLWALIDIFRQIYKKKIPYLSIVMSLIGISVVSWSFIIHYSMGVSRNNTHAHDYAVAVLSQVPQNTVLMCFADFSCFSLMYVQEVEGLRPDVKLVSKNIYIKGYFLRKNPGLKGLEDTDNPYFSADVISWNLYQNKPVYLTDLVGYYVNYVGMEGNPFFVIPEGYVFRVTKKIPDSVPIYQYPLTEKLLTYNRPEEDYWFAGQKDYFSNFHTIMGMVYSYLNLKEGAVTNLKLAMALTPDYAQAQAIYNQLATYEGNPNYHLGQESLSTDYYYDLAVKDIEGKKIDSAYKNIQKATFLDPKNGKARNLLAEILLNAGYLKDARIQYLNILRFDPENIAAKDRLSQLNTKLDVKN